MVLGCKEFKPEQEEATKQFVLGRDIFVALSTGYRKSLCYFCLPYVFDKHSHGKERSVFMVVSPLVVLIKEKIILVLHALPKG